MLGFYLLAFFISGGFSPDEKLLSQFFPYQPRDRPMWSVNLFSAMNNNSNTCEGNVEKQPRSKNVNLSPTRAARPSKRCILSSIVFGAFGVVAVGGRRLRPTAILRCDDDGNGGRETRASVIKCVQQQDQQRACVLAWVAWGRNSNNVRKIVDFSPSPSPPATVSLKYLIRASLLHTLSVDVIQVSPFRRVHILPLPPFASLSRAAF